MKSVETGIKRRVVMAAAAVMVIAGAVNAQTWDIGAWPNKSAVTATLNGRTLSIEGVGDMEYDRGPPWLSGGFANDIDTVIIGNGVTSIGNSSFSHLENLTSVTIPNSVTRIGDRAFSGAAGLTSVIIPSGVLRIDDAVFEYCTNLSRVDFLRQGPMILIGEDVFWGTPPSLRVYGFPLNINILIYPGITFVPYSGLSFSRTGENNINPSTYGSRPSVLTATLENTNYPLSVLSVALSGANASAFTVNQPSVALGGSATIRVSPRSGVAPGTYTATVTASAVPSADGETDWIAPRSFNVRATVNPRSVTITGLTAFNREYDGTTVALPRGTAGLANMVSGDNVSVVGGTASFADPNAGIGKTVTFSDFSLAGPDAGNYTLASQPSSVTADINPRPIIITGVTAVARNADGTTSVGLTGGTLVGILGSDVVDFVLGNGTIASPDAGTNKPVKTNIVLTGPGAPNYRLAQPGNITVDIGATSIAVIDREIPVVEPDDAAIFAAPVNQPSGEFTVGPNPAVRSSGVVNFYRQGRRVNDAVLTIFDAFGNVVNRVRISDNGGKNGRRIVGSWDLRDDRGRPVPAGTYLLRGTAAAADGNRERVSVIIGVSIEY